MKHACDLIWTKRVGALTTECENDSAEKHSDTTVAQFKARGSQRMFVCLAHNAAVL